MSWQSNALLSVGWQSQSASITCEKNISMGLARQMGGGSHISISIIPKKLSTLYLISLIRRPRALPVRSPSWRALQCGRPCSRRRYPHGDASSQILAAPTPAAPELGSQHQALLKTCDRGLASLFAACFCFEKMMRYSSPSALSFHDAR